MKWNGKCNKKKSMERMKQILSGKGKRLSENAKSRRTRRVTDMNVDTRKKKRMRVRLTDGADQLTEVRETMTADRL